MKIAVTGPNGQLGSELVRQGCIPLYGNLPGRDFDSVLLQELESYNPDAIINCAAFTAVDRARQEIGTAVGTNTRGVSLLIHRFDGYLVQISTDYVFDGKSGPYSPGDAPNPINLYGWSKLGGELLTRQHKGPWLIIRTTILFSATNNNFVAKIVKQLARGQKVTLYQPYLTGTPTYVPALAEEIIRQVNMGYTGISHIAGKKQMTRLEFARLIAEAFGFNPGDILTTDEVPGGAPRPPVAGLICDNSQYKPVISHDPAEGLMKLVEKWKRGEIWK